MVQELKKWKLVSKSRSMSVDQQIVYLLSDTNECQNSTCEDLNGMYQNSENELICDPVDLCSAEGVFYQNQFSERINVCISEC